MFIIIDYNILYFLIINKNIIIIIRRKTINLNIVGSI